jgi:formate-nitrite transporter family protein
MKRALPFIIIAAVAVLTAGIATLIYRGKMQPPPTPVPTASGSTAPAVPTPAPEDPSHVRGPANAPVTLEIYGDFQCPSCAVVSKGIDELEEQHAGQMRVIFHQFPLSMHKHAMQAALAAEAAGIQGKFWQMHDILYENQPAWGEATTVNFLFDSYAEKIGLDVARYRADRQALDLRMRVREAVAAGDSRGIKSTPTVFINGKQLRLGFTKDELEKAIDAVLNPQAHG